MSTYIVRWEMEFEADSPEDAARQALRVHRDPESIATVFDVEHCEDGPDKGSFTQVDLWKLETEATP